MTLAVQLQVVGVNEQHLGLPTSRQGVQGKVIDLIASARACTGPVWSQEDSCQVIDTDHELIMCMGYLSSDQSAKRRYDCRPMLKRPAAVLQRLAGRP